MNSIAVQFENGRRIRCAPNTTVGSLLKVKKAANGLPFIGCLVNNDVCSLSYLLDINCKVRFLTMDDSQGMRIYRNSLSFLLAKAAALLFPGARFCIQHSLSTGFFYTLETSGRKKATRSQVQAIEKCMRRLVARNLPIQRRNISFTEAMAGFEKAGQADKADLLRFRNPPKIVTYWCDAYSDLAHGPLAPNTGILKYFKLIHYPPGLVLQFPDREKFTRVDLSKPVAIRVYPFKDQPHLFQIFQEHKKWGRILGVNTVGKLNELIMSGGIRNFIKIAESFHENKIAAISNRIVAKRKRVKIILIAGPSASGKTTLAKRLLVQLQIHGLKPVMISLDNYYVDDADNPRDADGRPDYEHIDAIDLELFNRHLLRLVRGREVELPRFNFEKKKREYTGDKLCIARDQMIIVEGIHCLNPRLTHMIAAANKFKIYISALTQLNIDSSNRISTTDNRIMRRLVRDHTYRNNSALVTLRMWPSVRRGEKSWVFPFQALADATFNSALDYELAVLKPLIEPLLLEIKPRHSEYAEARRLQQFLSNFLGVSGNDVPRTSILREYIGTSSFQY